MLTNAQRLELSEALYKMLVRRIERELEANGALIDSAGVERLISILLEL